MGLLCQTRDHRTAVPLLQYSAAPRHAQQGHHAACRSPLRRSRLRPPAGFPSAPRSDVRPQPGSPPRRKLERLQFGLQGRQIRHRLLRQRCSEPRVRCCGMVKAKDAVAPDIGPAVHSKGPLHRPGIGRDCATIDQQRQGRVWKPAIIGKAVGFWRGHQATAPADRFGGQGQLDGQSLRNP